MTAWITGCHDVLDEVFAERVRQEERYGHVNHLLAYGTGPDVHWCAVDKAGGYSAVDVQQLFRWDYELHEEQQGLPTWMHLVREEVAEAFQESDPERLAEELIQVAALCVSWVERIRNAKQSSQDGQEAR